MRPFTHISGNSAAKALTKEAVRGIALVSLHYYK
jgi:hypothetical protein